MKNLRITVLWLDKKFGVAVDAKIGGKLNPVTKYVLWPDTDILLSLTKEIDRNSWISPTESSFLLSRVSDLLSYWKKKDTASILTLEKIKEKFSDCNFVGRK